MGTAGGQTIHHATSWDKDRRHARQATLGDYTMLHYMKQKQESRQIGASGRGPRARGPNWVSRPSTLTRTSEALRR